MDFQDPVQTEIRRKELQQEIEEEHRMNEQLDDGLDDRTTIKQHIDGYMS